RAIEKIAKKVHPEILRGLVVSGVDPTTLESKEKLERVFSSLKDELIAKEIHFEFSVSKDSEHNNWFATVESNIHGNKRVAPINISVLESPEYEELCKHYRALQSLGKGPFDILVEGKPKIVVKDGEELSQKILEIAKAGLTLQRYKGLGEMN